MYTNFCLTLIANDSDVRANFQDFLTMLRPPKVPESLKKKKKALGKRTQKPLNRLNLKDLPVIVTFCNLTVH